MPGDAKYDLLSSGIELIPTANFVVEDDSVKNSPSLIATEPSIVRISDPLIPS